MTPGDKAWPARHQAPRLRAAFGADDPDTVLGRAIAGSIRRCGQGDVLFLPALDPAREAAILAAAIQLAPSPRPWVVRAASAAAALPPGSFAAAVLTAGPAPPFAEIASLLHPAGRLLVDASLLPASCRCWPEVLPLLRHIWQGLPWDLRFDRRLGRLDPWLEGADYNPDLAPPVAPLDPLPALRAAFTPEAWHAWGGLTELLFGDRFGANYRDGEPTHRVFFARVQALEDHLLATGGTTPTRLLGVFRPGASVPTALPPGWARPLRPLPPLDLVRLGFDSPFASPPLPPLVSAPPGVVTWFGAAGRGPLMLRWGWSSPERDLTWAVGRRSALAFICPPGVGRLTLRSHGYLPGTEDSGRQVVVRLNGAELGVIIHPAEAPSQEIQWPLPPGLLRPEGNLLEFDSPGSHPAAPPPGTADRRPLSFALVSMEVR